MGDERARCMDAGLDDLLTKPISLEGLSAMLVRHIGLDRALSGEVLANSADPQQIQSVSATLDLDRLYHLLGRTSMSQARELLVTFMAAAKEGLRKLALRPDDVPRWSREMHRQHSSGGGRLRLCRAGR